MGNFWGDYLFRIDCVNVLSACNYYFWKLIQFKWVYTYYIVVQHLNTQTGKALRISSFNINGLVSNHLYMLAYTCVTIYRHRLLRRMLLRSWQSKRLGRSHGMQEIRVRFPAKAIFFAISLLQFFKIWEILGGLLIFQIDCVESPIIISAHNYYFWN